MSFKTEKSTGSREPGAISGSSLPLGSPSLSDLFLCCSLKKADVNSEIGANSCTTSPQPRHIRKPVQCLLSMFPLGTSLQPEHHVLRSPYLWTGHMQGLWLRAGGCPAFICSQEPDMSAQPPCTLQAPADLQQGHTDQNNHLRKFHPSRSQN